MAILHLLGTGAAVSDPHRTTTMLAIENNDSLIVIDCGADAVQKLMLANANIDNLEALIITHEHADHVSGFPLFMERIWLLGRSKPLAVYGIKEAIAQAQRIHDSFDTSDWPNYPKIEWHEFEHENSSLVLSDKNWEITANPGIHAVPVVGLRIVNKENTNILSYSCDTQYSENIIDLAKNSQILVHEASGEFPGHSTAIEAAQVAARANAKRLILVHLPPKEHLDNHLIAKARAIFSNTDKGIEGGKYHF
ncbi:MAG TPA: MBL fold metallo-hydrolase [Trueperaceae bacterium]|nr:MBL fold metallo-hydrolase [Trueperaceae bacterium]